jgi:hypothetical protein
VFVAALVSLLRRPATRADPIDRGSSWLRDFVYVSVILPTSRPPCDHYDHRVLMLQLMLWHEGYHHGQIKLALKVAGRPINDDDAGPFTWDVWRRRTSRHFI